MQSPGEKRVRVAIEAMRSDHITKLTSYVMGCVALDRAGLDHSTASDGGGVPGTDGSGVPLAPRGGDAVLIPPGPPART